MNFKKLLVSFVMLVSTLFLLSTVSATVVGLNGNFTVDKVTINDVDAVDASVIAGELVVVEVTFTADEDASDVRVTVELEGNKVDVEGTTAPFDVLANKTYKKSMVLRVPFELQENVDDVLTLNLEIKGNGVTSFVGSEDVTVQRPSYNVDFMSVNTGQAVAGKTLSVDVVLKNTGYNKLDDLYVTVSIPELDVKRMVYARDLVQIKVDEDNDDTVEVSVNLDLPFNAKQGVYNLEVEAKNSDMKLNKVKEILVKNDFSSMAFVSGSNLVLLNPTDSLMVLRLVPQFSEGVSITLSENVVTIPAGSSKAVTVSATGSEEYTVDVFKMNGELVESVKLTAKTSSTGSEFVTVLTAVLLVVFLVLLAVLVVLVTKKPQKDEEFSESYY
jgi:hypothetical protein